VAVHRRRSGQPEADADRPASKVTTITETAASTSLTHEPNKRSKPKAVSLFAGAGGMSLGMADAGFDVVFATDHDAHSASTYEVNHPETVFQLADARDLTIWTILDAVGLRPGEPDLVFGGPPCRGFSTGNRHNGGLNNPHNALVREFARLVLELQPRWFVMENVTGLWRMDRGKVRYELLHKLGTSYTVWLAILNAADFGVPQLRHRVFFVGTRDPVEFEFPVGQYGQQPTLENPCPVPYVSLDEAISDLPSLSRGQGKDIMNHRRKPRSEYQRMMREGCDQVINHIITRSSPAVIERYRHIKPGGNWSSLSDRLIGEWRTVPIDQVKEVSHGNLYRRLKPGEPAPTIGNFRKSMFIHPTENRGLSVREAARLQSFPDWYEFQGGIASMQQQVGNATPPLLAKAIGRQMLKYISGND